MWGAFRKGDDYHYHGSPTCLMDMLGDSDPLGYAFDGFAIYGYNEVDGSSLDASSLDEINGHVYNEEYHYHVQDVRPYFNGGFRGGYDTNSQGGQPMPERDIELTKDYIYVSAEDNYIISDFYLDDDGWYNLEYDLVESVGDSKIRYRINGDGSYDFQFYDLNGNLVYSETYPINPI